MTTLVPYSNGRRFATWDPWRLFDDLLTWEPPGAEAVWTFASPASPMKVEANDDGATVTIDMPGVDPADLELTFEAGTLHIAGKRGDHTYRYRVALGDAIDPSAIEAELDKGVLVVRAPKRPEAKPRKIALKGAAQKSLAGGDHK